MKIQKILSSLFLACVAIGFSACNSDDDQQYMQVTNIVTYLGTNTAGQTMFDYQEMNDAPNITLVSNAKLNSDVTIGSRLLIAFSVPAGTEIKSGMVVDLYSASIVPTLKPIVGTVPVDKGQLYVQTLFRSGTWLNMQALIPYSTDTKLSVIVDPSSLNTSTVQMYLIMTGDAGGVSSSTSFASIDIKEYWEDSSYRTIELHVNNSNSSGSSTFTFNK